MMLEESSTVTPVGPLLVLEIGKLQGVQSTMMTSVNSSQVELRRLGDELERKHEANRADIIRARQELTDIMNQHSKDDDVRFNRVSRIVWAAGGIFGFVNFVLLIANLWKNFHPS